MDSVGKNDMERILLLTGANLSHNCTIDKLGTIQVRLIECLMAGARYLLHLLK
jgi:hypothetical protein